MGGATNIASCSQTALLVTAVSGEARRDTQKYGAETVGRVTGRTALPLRSPSPLTCISAGLAFAAATNSDGQLYVWGETGADRVGLSAVSGGYSSEVESRLNQPLGEGSGRRNVMCAPFSVTMSDHACEQLATQGEEDALGEGAPHPGHTWVHEHEAAPVELNKWRGERFTFVCCGRGHVVALTDVGGCYTWGSGHGYRLGHGTDVCENRPRLVSRLADLDVRAVHAAAGEFFTAVVTSAGSVFAWGESLTHTSVKHINIRLPRQVSHAAKKQRFTNVHAFCCGAYFLALRDNGRSVCGWGNRTEGQFGQAGGNRYANQEEIQLPFEQEGDALKQVSCGRQHILYLSQRGDVYTCGSEQRGGRREVLPFSKVKGVGVGSSAGEVEYIGAGDGVSFVLNARGQVYTWGVHSIYGAWETIESPVHLEAFSAQYGVGPFEVGCGETDLVFFEQPQSLVTTQVMMNTLPLWRGQSPRDPDMDCSPFVEDLRIILKGGHEVCVHTLLVGAVSPTLLAELRAASKEGVVDLREWGKEKKVECLSYLAQAPHGYVDALFSLMYGQQSGFAHIGSECDSDLCRALFSNLLPSSTVQKKVRGEGGGEGEKEGGVHKSENEDKKARAWMRKGVALLSRSLSRLASTRARTKSSKKGKPDLTSQHAKDAEGDLRKFISTFSPNDDMLWRALGDSRGAPPSRIAPLSASLCALFIAMNTTSEHGCDDEGDFALIVRHVKLRCHKAMLASDFFAAAFAAGLKEAKEGVMVVSDEGISPSAAFVFLDLLYGAPFILSSDSPLALLNGHLSVAGLDEVKAEDLPSVCEAVQLMAGLYSLDRVGVAAANLCILSTLTDANFCTAAEVVTAACEEDLTSKLKWKLDGSSHILFKDKAHSILESILDGREEEE